MQFPTESRREQYYVFTGPDGWAWCEMFFDGLHVTAPTPFQAIAEAVRRLEEMHPTAVVDTLWDAADMVDAMRYAS
jgi:hypothetical protein